MLLYNDYKDVRRWIRYYIQKFCPSIFYPILLKYFYRKFFNKEINLKNPKTFSEKLNYLKIYNVTPEKVLFADKLQAKKYIQKNFPDLHTAKLYQVCSSFEEIDFSKCPETFLIKTNHAWKSARLIENKNLITKKELNNYSKYYKKVLKINYAFWGTLELQYKDIKPLIYIEEYLHNDNNSPFFEYEVYCFNGRAEFTECHDFNGKPIENYNFGVSFFDRNWKETEFSLFYKRGSSCSPDNFNRDNIIKYAELLSKNFIFTRVDFFEINKKLYFGELTFTPFSGDIKFFPDEYNIFFGNKLQIF